MEKRGVDMISREIISIIIMIIIVLVIFAYLFSTLSGSFFGKQEKLQAQGQLSQLVNTLNNVDVGESKSFLLYTPQNWWLISFFSDTASNKINAPADCWKKDCICICEKANNCEKEKICEIIEKPLKKDNEQVKLEIKLVSLTIANKEKEYEITFVQEPEITKITTKPDISVSSKYSLQSYKRSEEIVVDRIILHHTNTASAKETYEILNKRGLSVHYIIDKDGTIYYIIDEKRLAHHTLGWNSRSIGIEIVNLGCKTDEYTDKQYDSIKRLINDIANRRESISIDNEHIIGHYQAANEGKWDPSPNFDWERIGLSKHLTLADLGRSPPNEGWLTCII